LVAGVWVGRISWGKKKKGKGALLGSREETVGKRPAQRGRKKKRVAGRLRWRKKTKKGPCCWKTRGEEEKKKKKKEEEKSKEGGRREKGEGGKDPHVLARKGRKKL